MAINNYGNYTYAILENRATTTPARVALTHVVRGDVTYGELRDRVHQRANALLEAGVRPEDRVACLVYDQLATIELYLALAEIGAVIVAANPFWDDETLGVLLERAESSFFVYDDPCREAAERAADRLRSVRTWFRIGGTGRGEDLDALTSAASVERPPVSGSWDDVLLLSFTSGTTSLPKAVTHTHASSIENARLWTDVPRGEDAAMYTGSGVGGIIFTSAVGPALWGGLRLILEENGGPAEFIAATQRHRVTHLSTVVSYFTGALRDAPADADLSSLRVVLLGGEPVTRSALRLAHDRVPDVKVFSFYGQSEAPFSFITHTPFREDGDGGPSGYTVQTGYAAKVIDGHGEVVVDEVGEICLGGAHVFVGYDAQPEKTAEALKDGWYIGGDLGLMGRDGRVTVYGRREDAAVRDGVFVLPTEVEEYASRARGVSEVGAVVIGEGDSARILLAVVGDGDLTDEGMLAHMVDAAPKTHVPDAVIIVDDLPYATNIAGRGKLLRREIAVRWADVLQQPA